MDVTVTTAGGTSATSAADQFIYYIPAPTVGGLNPATGPTTGGTTVTITGTDLDGATAVMFGNNAAAIQSDTVTQIVVVAPAGMAGTVDVTVTTAGGTSATSSADQFTYYIPAPTVGGLNPTTGPTTGGTTVTITGTNLTGATGVKFGNNAAAIQSDTVTQIVVVAPAGMAGTVDVTVTTAGGTSATSWADRFTYYVPAPTVGGLNPTTGPTTDGTTVTITGTNLDGATAVDFGSVAGTIQSDSGSQIVVTSPAGVTGSVDVTVTTAGGTSATSSADQFTYYVPAPTVGGLNPTTGPTTGGTTVTITGTNLAGATAVDFGSLAATIQSDSATQIVVVAPAGTAGTVDVTVITAGGTSATSSADRFTYYVPAPTVGGLNPTTGPTTGGTTVTITGTNLDGATAVDFGSLAATIQSDSATQIVVVAPAGAAGAVDVTVTTAGGTSASTSADRFTYYVPAPTVGGLNPTTGPTTGGTTVTITGTNLAGATGVKFGNVVAQVQNDTSTQIVVSAPAGVAGAVDVTVTTAGGTSASTSADRFTYYVPAPTVGGLSPTTGPTTGGTTVTITGTNLAGATGVKFGSVVAQVQNDTSTQIVVSAPAGVAGTVDVTVTTAGGTSASTSADRFTYYVPAPTVGGLSPTTGPTTGGTTVTITGTNLAGATAVDFGSVAAAIQSDTAAEILVVAPAGAAGTVDVTVTTAGGASATTWADQFTYYVPAPTVEGLNPTTGPTIGGTTVAITGTNLDGATAVRFGNNAATIRSDTATQIVVVAPAGAAGTVDVTVTAAGGTSATTAADQFTYFVAPGVPSVGLYDRSSAIFMLRNTNDSGFADEVSPCGVAGPGLLPIAGDWNGDGTESIGLFDPATSTFYLRNTNCLQGPDDHGAADCTFTFGPSNAGYEPVVGDWDGDGRDTVGLYDPATSTFYLRNSNSLQGPNDHAYADIVFTYGPAHSGMLPVAGDWDGSGKDGIGLYSEASSTFYLRESTKLQGSNDKGYADATLNYGAPHIGLVPIAGDWNSDGKDGIGLYDPATATFLLRNAIQLQGPSDRGFAEDSLVAQNNKLNKTIAPAERLLGFISLAESTLRGLLPGP